MRRGNKSRETQRTGQASDGTVWPGGDVQRLTADVRVPQGATLTIQPGAIIQVNPFAGIDLAVEGKLDARGTAAAPILFTSVRDDTGFDGILGTADDLDTNNDGLTSGSNGDWNSIQFSATSTGNVLDQVEVRFGGAGSSASVVTLTSGLSLTNSVIRNSSTAGLRIANSSPTLTNNVFTNNGSSAVSMDIASNPAISGVTVSNNGWNGLTVDGGTLPGNRQWDDPDMVYRVGGDVTVPTGRTLRTLTIGAGQVVKMAGEDVVLFVNGTLLVPK